MIEVVDIVMGCSGIVPACKLLQKFEIRIIFIPDPVFLRTVVFETVRINYIVAYCSAVEAPSESLLSIIDV